MTKLPDVHTRAEVIAEASKYVGVPYVSGGSTPSGFDCSGFVRAIYEQTVGMVLPLLCAGDLFSLAHYWRKWDARNLKYLLPGAAAIAAR